jgi:hypothetical protein
MTTLNEFQSFEEDFIRRIRENDAWRKLSGNSDIPWSEKLIESHADQWDWTELCENRSIAWTVDMIEKFKSRIDWNTLSSKIIDCGYRETKPIDWDILKKFDAYWNWHLLSKNSDYIPNHIIEQFADKWDWKELIENRAICWSPELFQKFKRFIPVGDFSKFKNSALWDKLVEHEEKVLVGKMLANC